MNIHGNPGLINSLVAKGIPLAELRHPNEHLEQIEKEILEYNKRICPVCKKEFQCGRSARKYCSDECSSIMLYIQSLERHRKSNYALGRELYKKMIQDNKEKGGVI